MNKKKLTRVIPVLAVLGLLVALLLFEQVNYITTYESLAAVFGAGTWIQILAVAVVVTDFAALSRVFMPSSEKGEDPKVVTWLILIWFAVSSLDVILSWFFAALRMENNQVNSPAAMDGMLWIMPILVAVIIWGVQFGILYFLSAMLDKAVYGRVRPIIQGGVPKPRMPRRVPSDPQQQKLPKVGS